MRALFSLLDRFGTRLDRLDWLLPTLARLIFVGVLLMYFWISGLTKLGEGFAGLWQLDFGAYAQILPRATEAAGYDIDAMQLWHHFVVYAGTYAEFILPALIVIGLLTRLSALGMIGFIVVQSLTDLFGHGALGDEKAVGAWFDKASDSLIMDQRALWVLLLAVLVIKGGGPISFDRALRAG